MSKRAIKNKSSGSTLSRIYNPVTKTYYSVRLRKTSAGEKGTIIGKWSPKK